MPLDHTLINMHLPTPLTLPMLTGYQSPMDNLQDTTFGHLQVHLRRCFQLIMISVLALTPDTTGRTLLLPGWATITSVTVATLDPALIMVETIAMIPSGMDRDVHPPAPAVSSITLHGSAKSCHKPSLTVSKSGYVVLKVGTLAFLMKTY